MAWIDPLMAAWERAMRRLAFVLGGLTLAVVVLVFAQVLLRYVLPVLGAQWGFIAMQEAVQMLHSTVFMLGAVVALHSNQHVRVDILQSRWPARAKALAELLGTLLFLLPFCGFLMVISYDYVASSWAALESSAEAGGLPGVYLWKSLLLLSAALLLLQGLVMVLQQWQRWRAAGRVAGPATDSAP